MIYDVFSVLLLLVFSIFSSSHCADNDDYNRGFVDGFKLGIKSHVVDEGEEPFLEVGLPGIPKLSSQDSFNKPYILPLANVHALADFLLGMNEDDENVLGLAEELISKKKPLLVSLDDWENACNLYRARSSHELHQACLAAASSGRQHSPELKPRPRYKPWFGPSRIPFGVGLSGNIGGVGYGVKFTPNNG